MDNTICAISTSSGMGAISIIRVSGNEAVGIVNKIFKGHRLDKVASHTINYGHIIDENNKIIDEVLVSVMLAPKTYTTEDTIEINCHGGLISANKILQLLVKNGCALAEPGEFTKRAFLNGRMGLVEAEAVSEIINSETNKSQELAVNQLSGKISNKIKTLRSNIMDVLSFIEVTIDYPEYTDIDTLEDEEMIKKIKETKETIEHLIKESENGKVIQNGINVALIGEPNVGKSSLMNALIGEERAIVTNIAGTTRDSIEAKFTLKNIAINLIDTAGIHETDDIIEQIGIDKSLKAIEEADLIILLLDGTKERNKKELDLIEKIKNKKHIIFVNKNDISNKEFNLNVPYITGNTVTDDGLDTLKSKIIEMFNLDEIELSNPTYLSSNRQITLLNSALTSINDCLIQIELGAPIDILAVDLKQAWISLGEITGETYSEELLDNLFSRFCLGK